MKRLGILLLLLLAAPFLVGFRLLLAATLQEPWATFIFLIVVPLLVQALKFIADKQGATVADYVAQGMSFLLAIGYMIVTGGFAGLTLPIFPTFSGDAIAFAGAFLMWGLLWLQLVITALGSVEVVYRMILKAMLERAGFATKADIAKRKEKDTAKRAGKKLTAPH